MTEHNYKELREALERIHDACNNLNEDCAVDPVEIRDIARRALLAPARNCDVGTPTEQGKRFFQQCAMWPDCTGCPINKPENVHTDCALAWAQLPFGEEE